MIYSRNVCEQNIICILFWDFDETRQAWQRHIDLLHDFPWTDGQCKLLYRTMVAIAQQLGEYTAPDLVRLAVEQGKQLPNWLYHYTGTYTDFDRWYRQLIFFAFGDDAERKLEEAKKLLKDINTRDKGMAVLQSIDPPMLEEAQSIDITEVLGRVEESAGKSTLVLPTGLKDLDAVMSFEPGGLYFIGARPSVGKTTVALNMAFNLAYREGKKVLYLTTEMDAESIGRRILSRVTKSKYSDFLVPLRGDLQKKVQAFVASSDAYLRANGGVLKTEPIRAIDMHQLRQIVQYHVYVNKVQYVFIDYIGHIRAEGKTEYEQATNRSNDIRKLTTEHNVVTIALMQLNRQADGKEEFSMSMARSSGQQEADAHGMIFLRAPRPSEEDDIFRDSFVAGWAQKKEYEEIGQNELGFEILKNRNGRKGKFTQLYIPEHFFVGGEYEQKKYMETDKNWQKIVKKA